MKINGESNRTLSSTVLTAIADREEVDPVDLSEPLFSSVDIEAIDRLFNQGEGSVTFEYLNYEVVVHSDGNVDVREVRPTR